MKPAGPARKLQSHSPPESLVAINAISMRAMNSRITGVRSPTSWLP
jgi:hypothetical protein